MASAVFGPYLAPNLGIRTEQTVVYAAVVLILVCGVWNRVRLNSHGVLAVGLQCVILVAAGIGTLFPVAGSAHQSGSALAMLDNLILPLCVIAVTAALGQIGGDRTQMIAALCRTVVWLMIANAFLTMVCVSSGTPEWLFAWWSGGGEAVAHGAEQMGRFSGIFNQPAEAGVLYSVAILGAIWLYQRSPVRLALVLVVLCSGGIITVSKIFLLGGIPVAVWQLLRPSMGWWRRSLAVTVAMAGAWIFSGAFPAWADQTPLFKLFPSNNADPLKLVTAGRFGEESILAPMAEVVWQSSPLVGLGVTGQVGAVDNGWMQALVVAGSVGVVGYTLLLATLAAAWWRIRDNGPDARLAGGLLIIVAGGSLGLPVLTANRTATILWMLLVLLLLTPTSQRPNRDSHGGASSDQGARTVSRAAKTITLSS
ncbi:hypothetical protein QQG74_11135 [Micromonospora sp. FIMYZ51]|uniref:hypothetical protein n=1 Tax=Micromonospora sp. FIMYZ51 TaxID=3051832 RepID=UPI00311E9DD9